MSDTSKAPKFGTARLLDEAHAGLEGQTRVNAEIFKAMEILGRKLERTEQERDVLARRLALIESSTVVDETTGKLYLPAIIDNQTSPAPAYATPRWMVAASLMSSAVALLAIGLVMFRDPVSPLS